jgi:hypothetical protein
MPVQPKHNHEIAMIFFELGDKTIGLITVIIDTSPKDASA